MMTRGLTLCIFTAVLLMAVDAEPQRGVLDEVNMDRQYGDGTSPSPCPTYDSRPPAVLQPNSDYLVPPMEYERPQTFGPSEFGNIPRPVQPVVLPPAPIQSSYPTPVSPDIVDYQPVQPVSPCGTFQQPSLTVVPVPLMLMSGQPCNQPSCCPGYPYPETLAPYDSGIIPQLNYPNRVLAGPSMPSDMDFQLQGPGINPSVVGPGGKGSLVVPEPGGGIIPGSRRPFAGMPPAPSQLNGGIGRPQGLGGQVIAPRAADNLLEPELNPEEDNEGSSTAISNSKAVAGSDSSSGAPSTAILNSEAVATSESDVLSSGASKADASSTSAAVASSGSSATAGA